MEEVFLSEGKCVYCEEFIEKSKLNTHLKKHLKSNLLFQPLGTSFLLQIFTYNNYKNSPYFLYVLADGQAKMKDLDLFLRNIWVDCCGHLSEFQYKGGQELPKSRVLEQALEKNVNIQYEYDFGTTTYLQIKVIEEFSFKAPKKISLLSRNEPLKIMCHTCKKKPAVTVCSVEQWDDKEHMFCEKCALEHEKICSDFSDYAAMPVVNSPRMAECGYMGGSIDTERDGIYVLK